MSRRSPRLISMGHYNDEGEPIISYKETLRRVFTRRRYRHGFQPVQKDTTIIDNDKSTRKITRKNTRKSIRNNKIISKSNSTSRIHIICIFFLMLSLCFGFINFINVLDPTFLSETPESPIYMDTNSIEGSEEIMEQLEKIEEELLDLKKKIDALTPLADALSNFALESQGASVLFHLSSKTYSVEKPYLKFFGIPIWRPSINPRIVIQGDSHLIPGRCWAFAGEQGHLLIALSQPVTISHVSLGHICKNLSPTGSISSAPKEFSVYGLETLDDEGTQLGTFLYDQDGDEQQTFKLLDHKKGAYKFVKLEVQSNWGHPEYSCLYSFRVHGRAVD